MKFRRLLYGAGAFFLLLIKFTLDVVGKSVELSGLVLILREVLTIAAFALIALLATGMATRREGGPVRKIGFLLVALLPLAIATTTLAAIPSEGFEAKDFVLRPMDFSSIFIGSLLSVLIGSFAIVTFRLHYDLIVFAGRRGARWNAVIFGTLVLATAGTAFFLRPLETSLANTALFAGGVLAAVPAAFRLPWIVYLTKREKIFALIFSFLLFLGFLWMNILVFQSPVVRESLLFYSAPLKEFLGLTFIAANIYFGMAFVSTLFHLPTADAFERKRAEVTSLSTLSKLVTQAFDFNELVDTVTSMTMQVCEASSCWLETLGGDDELAQPGAPAVVVAGRRNISEEEILDLVPAEGESLRTVVLRDRRPLLVDNVPGDPRFRKGVRLGRSVGSLAVVPLQSHTGPVGLLYATKETRNGFGKEDLDLITAFADQAGLAIENSRLVKKSLERERLLREMLLAQEMQRRLLPQVIPSFTSMELDAVSTPAFEVGGDYYDFMQFDQNSVGIIVGDVSGKGVSAAFYMSEVKGIFQALGRMYASPRQFMLKANEALAGSIDRRSFVSLIYALVDTRTGHLRLSRAGHCPMLHVSAQGVSYVRPNGIGLGLTVGEVFESAMEEDHIQLQPGDVCLFYTDGVTEAMHNGEEFGYQRLKELTEKLRSESASAIKGGVLETVQTFVGDDEAHDDLTLVVLKWHGDGLVPRPAAVTQEEPR
jgi:sigma-B regulation protein RsbU (phosphoserine phosphatase)